MPSPKSKPNKANKRPRQSKTTKAKRVKTQALVHVPRPRTNYKGVMDIKAPVQIDWRVLKLQFLADPNYTKVRTWLRDIQGWPENKILSGWVVEHTSGWGNDKAIYRQEIITKAIEDLRRLESERTPDLLTAKLNIIASFVNDSNPELLKKLSPMDRTFLLRALKTELGEPSSINSHTVKPELPQRNIPDEVAERLIKDAIKS